MFFTFFESPKKRDATFYVFWSGILKNVKNVIQKFEFQNTYNII